MSKDIKILLTSTGKSLTSKKVDSIFKLFDISNRLQDVVTEIDLHHETLMDKNVSERNKSQSLKNLKGTIRRYLASSSISIAAAATQLSPIAGIPYVSKVKEREKKIQLLQSKFIHAPR